MENIFIILAIIVSVVYKFYENYKKEMEEAAKRQQKARRVPPPVESSTVPPARTTKPMHPRPTVQLPQRPATPIPEIRQPIPRQAVSPSAQVRPQPEQPAEVAYASRMREERKKLQALEVIKSEEDEMTNSIQPIDFEFDLKTAVIQSAILERPYNKE